MKTLKKTIAAALTFAAFLSCEPPKAEVDLLVYAHIHTMGNPETVEAMAINDGVVIAIGSKKEIQENYTSGVTLDQGDDHIYPGFHDAHCHFLGQGQTMQRVDLRGTTSYSDVINQCLAFNEKQNLGYVRGRGWDQEDWKDTTTLTNQALNMAFPTIPVLIRRIDGHAALANAKALEMAGFTSKTRIDGGELQVIQNELTGFLIDNAVDTLIERIFTAPTPEQNKQAILLAQEKCLEYGLTSLTDAGLDWEEIKLFSELHASGELKIRINSMVSYSPENMKGFDTAQDLESDRLRIRSVKFYADGALGSRGACLLHPYSDRPGWSGYLVNPKARLEEAAASCLEKGVQLCTHAIGDSANRMVLDVYEDFLAGKNDKRWRIEHAQVVHPEDFSRFDGKNIIPSVQPTHATSDMYWAEDRLGKDRIERAYAYKTLLGQSGILPLGTDFPVEEVSPFLTWYAALTRQDLEAYPPQGFRQDQALTTAEVLKGMTSHAAYAGFLEGKLGSLEPGKKADFIGFKTDLEVVNPKDIPELRPHFVFIDGEKVKP